MIAYEKAEYTKTKTLLINYCPFCGKANVIEVFNTQLAKFEADDTMCVAEAFPQLSITNRETLITGVCPECQSSIPYDNDDDDDYYDDDEEDIMDADCEDIELILLHQGYEELLP